MTGGSWCRHRGWVGRREGVGLPRPGGGGAPPPPPPAIHGGWWCLLHHTLAHTHTHTAGEWEAACLLPAACLGHVIPTHQSAHSACPSPHNEQPPQPLPHPTDTLQHPLWKAAAGTPIPSQLHTPTRRSIYSSSRADHCNVSDIEHHRGKRGHT